jgi:phosphate transport system permease protein
MTSILDRPLKPRTIPGLGRRRRFANIVATVLVTLATAIALAPLFLVLYSVFAKGIRVITSRVWWTHSQAGTTAIEAGGGAYHAIVGTLLQGVLCAAISIPIGLMVAVYLVEYGGGTRLGRLVTFMVDILSGVPSVVAALFIYAVCVATLGLARSELVVSLALVLLMLPVIVRSPRGQLRAGHPEVENHCQSGDPDRAGRNHHRDHAGAGQGARRDRPAADPGGLLAGDQLRHTHRVHGIAAWHDV